MANNYIHLSMALTFPSEDSLKKALDYCLSDEFLKLVWAESFGAHEPFEKEMAYQGFDISQVEENKLWIRDDGESVFLENLAMFLKWVSANCLSNAVIGFQWSNTCSKPRIGEFSGGAFWTNGTEEDWISTSLWLEKAKVTNFC